MAEPTPAPAPTPAPTPAPSPAPAPLPVDPQGLVALLIPSLVPALKAALAPAPTPPQERTLQERAADVDAKLAKVEAAGRNQAIVALASKIGVNPELVDVFAREFAHHAGTGLKYDIETGLSYTDALGMAKPIDQIATAFLTTKSGAILKAAPPVKAAGNGYTQPGNTTLVLPDQKPYSELSPAERAKMTPAERAAYVQADLRRARAAS